MKQNTILTVKAEIILGKPSEGCQGHGICRILTQSLMEPVKCPLVAATISLGADNQLWFSFPKSALSKQEKDKHFSTPWFSIDEPILLPGRLKAKFQYKRTGIMQGQYKIYEDEQFFVIAC